MSFENKGDSVEGRFIGFKETRFGTAIQIEKKDKEIVTLPNLEKLTQMIPDLEVWNNEFKQVHLKITYTADIVTNAGTMKDLEIQVKKV